MLKLRKREPLARAIKINFKETEQEALLSSAKIGRKSRECGEDTMHVKNLPAANPTKAF